MPNSYIPKTIVPTQSTLIIGNYTFEPIPILNPTIANLELEHNPFVN